MSLQGQSKEIKVCARSASSLQKLKYRHFQLKRQVRVSCTINKLKFIGPQLRLQFEFTSSTAAAAAATATTIATATA